MLFGDRITTSYIYTKATSIVFFSVNTTFFVRAVLYFILLPVMLGTSWDLGKLPGYLALHMAVIVHVFYE